MLGNKHTVTELHIPENKYSTQFLSEPENLHVQRVFMRT